MFSASSRFSRSVALLWVILGMVIPSWAQSASVTAPDSEPPDTPKTRIETWFYYQENADNSGQYKLTEKV